MADALAEDVDPDALANLRIVISELVALSVAHGASTPIDMRIDLVEDEIEGVVDDHGPGVRAIQRAQERRDDSLVLRMIDGVVEEWEVTQHGVRFRLPSHETS
jgi:anti-sigma regulatory factor (Ser/Thr protein kinase)